MTDILYLFQYVDVYILITVRLLACLSFLPIIEETKLPRIALVGLSLCLAMPIYFKLDVAASYYTPTLFGFTSAIVKEMLVGLIISFTTKIFFQIYPFMGALLSMQGGISMSTVMDPTSGTQSTTLGRLYNLGFTAIFLMTGGYHWLIYTLVDSFNQIPLNQGIFRPEMTQTLVETIASYLEIGLKLALPVIAVILIIDFAMGILARTVPQMNMFVIGIPLKMLVMFVLLAITIGMVTHYNDIIINTLVDTVTKVIAEMRAL